MSYLHLPERQSVKSLNLFDPSDLVFVQDATGSMGSYIANGMCLVCHFDT